MAQEIELAYQLAAQHIRLTYGPAGSRQHIWSFAAALHFSGNNFMTSVNCACTNVTEAGAYTVKALHARIAFQMI